MKILLCHNHYAIRAGEDQVFASEMQMLRARGHTVISYTRDNADIASISLFRKIQSVLFGIYNPRTVKDIKDIVRREQPDVAHVHNVFPLLSPSLYCTLKSMQVPVVQTIHNFRFFCCNGLLLHGNKTCSPSPLLLLRCVFSRCYRNSFFYSAWYAAIIFWHRFRKTFVRCIDRYIVLNTFTRDVFIRNGFDQARIIVKPNAADVPELVSSGVHDYAVFIGRFSTEKGVITLLDALKRLPAFPVKLIGSGPLDDYVKQAVSSKSFSHVELLGYLPFDDCCRYAADALVSIFPSECYENCPLTVITSLWYGTPVVASHIGGIPDFVPEQAGWLFEPGNADALAERLQWIYTYRSDVIAMRDSVKAYARDRFSPDTNYRQLLAVYQSLVHDPLSGVSCG